LRIKLHTLVASIITHSDSGSASFSDEIALNLLAAGGGVGGRRGRWRPEGALATGGGRWRPEGGRWGFTAPPNCLLVGVSLQALAFLLNNAPANKFLTASNTAYSIYSYRFQFLHYLLKEVLVI